MSTINYSPEDLAELLTRVHEVLDAHLQPLAALVELLDRPTNVTVVASDGWEANTVSLGVATPVQIAPADLTRLRCTNYNAGTLPVYLSRRATATLVTQPGGILIPGASITLATVAEINATCPAGTPTDPGSLAVFIEWRDAGGAPAVPAGG